MHLRAAPALALLLALPACTEHGPAPEATHSPPPPRPEPRPQLPAQPPPAIQPPALQPRPPTGCLGERRDIALPEWPLNGAIADLDGDGHLDVLANYTLESAVEVLRGDGDAGFSIDHRHPLAAEAIGLVVADFDGDGRLDLAASHSREPLVSVYLGEPGARFATAPIRTRVDRHVGGGAAGDLDGDGRLDLVVPLWSRVALLLGDGRGGFRVAQKIATGQAPERPLLVDLDRDGDLDLAVASNDDHHLAVFRGDGRGRIRADARHPCGQGGAGVAAFDLDRDGAQGLAVANIHSQDVCVFRGDGHGGVRLHAVLPVGTYPNRVAAEDLDADGDADLLVLAWGPRPGKGEAPRRALEAGQIFVYRSDGQGGFREDASVAVGASPNELWLADLDGDRRLDAVTLNSNGRSLSVLRGTPSCAGG